MRTREEWFNLLNEDQQRRVFFNIIKEVGASNLYDLITEKVKDMFDAIAGAFYMDETPERKDYWLDIAKDPQWKQYEENK